MGCISCLRGDWDLQETGGAPETCIYRTLRKEGVSNACGALKHPIQRGMPMGPDGMQNEVASRKFVEGWEDQFEKGLPPPPDGSFSTGSLMDEYISRQGVYGTVIVPLPISQE